MAATRSPQRAWITSDDEPGDLKCYRVFYPDGYLHSLLGALVLLTREENWETVGSADAEAVAGAFNSAFRLTTESGACVPTGAIIWGGWVEVPTGYLPCDGAEYATLEYPALFDAIGYQFGGSGDNFRVPSMHRRVPIGIGGDINPGDVGGFEDVTLSEPQMPIHNHATIPATIGFVVPGTPMLVWIPSGIPTGYTGSAGGGQSHPNMPPYMGLIAVIKT